MNMGYASFPSLGFQGKNICVMCVFSIVSFLFFYRKFVCSKILYMVKIYIWYQSFVGFMGTPLWSRVCLGTVISLVTVGDLRYWFFKWKEMVSSSKMEIEKFNGKIVELWKLKMEYLLVDRDQWIMVDPSIVPTIMLVDDWKMLDQKVNSTIWLCLSDSVLLNLSGKSTTKELWNKLGKMYQYMSLENNFFLQKKLYNLRMRDGDSMI